MVDLSAAQATVAFLRDAGAADLGHAGGRTLLDHLVGTRLILSRWEQPVWVQQAALIHSIYGTDAFRPHLLPASRRSEVAAVVGDRAERLAYLFCATPRGPLLAGTHLWARDLPARSIDATATDRGPQPTPEELDALVLLHMANIAEQTQADDGSPGRWLARLCELGELLRDPDHITVPVFIARAGELSEADETLALGSYRDGSDRGVPGDARQARLALAAAACPVVAEPYVWLAHLSRCQGDLAGADVWAGLARQRLLELGTSWDKRLTFEQWLAIVEALGEPSERTPGQARRNSDGPHELWQAYVEVSTQARGPVRVQRVPQPDPTRGRKRFFRYVEALGNAGGAGSGAIYPDLPSAPWYDGTEFPLVEYLECNFPAIREEILSLDTTRFHPESERIDRSGDWDVAFLYERGRRHDDVCEALPVTSHGIETHPTIRTLAGLIYVSRMRAGTHIAAHRGPTNLRVRCHLGVKVPAGDCAIRVGDETHRWQEGKCLVFDDFFDHEAWNRTGDDRVVLIVDVWHPGLSTIEVSLLQGLQRYAHLHARKLSRYWSANAAAARSDRRGR